MMPGSTQEAILLASTFLAAICLFIPFVLRNELKNSGEKYYLIAFYFSAIVHFVTVTNYQLHKESLIPVLKYIAIINGALFPFFLAAFICKRENAKNSFRALVAIVFVNLVVGFWNSEEVYLSVMFALFSNIIGLIAVLRHIRTKADIGLALCFFLFTCVLVFVLIQAPFNVNHVTFYYTFYPWLLIFIPGFICGTTNFIFLRYVVEKNKELKELAHKDALTGLYNRRFAFELIEKSISFMKRDKIIYCVIMADLDHFKSVNDSYGHQVGDEVIKTFARCMLEGVREYDVVCRYGGEEFLIFLPSVYLAQAEEVAQRIRTKLHSEKIEAPSASFNVTASLGIAFGTSTLSIDQVINNADKALYHAKQNGRNAVNSYDTDKADITTHEESPRLL